MVDVIVVDVVVVCVVVVDVVVDVVMMDVYAVFLTLYLSRKLKRFRGRKIQAQFIALNVNWRLFMSALRIIKTTKLVQPHS